MAISSLSLFSLTRLYVAVYWFPLTRKVYIWEFQTILFFPVVLWFFLNFIFIMFWWNFTKKFRTSVFCCHLSTELFKVSSHQQHSYIRAHQEQWLRRCQVLAIKWTLKTELKVKTRQEHTRKNGIYINTYVFHKWSHHFGSAWINGTHNINPNKFCVKRIFFPKPDKIFFWMKWYEVVPESCEY